MNQKMKQSLLVGFIVVSLLYSAFTVTRIIATSQLQDFRLYYLGAQSILLGKNPYKEVQGVIYPPIALVLLTPFAALPYSVAEDVWTVLSVIALLSSIFLLISSTGQKASVKLFLIITGVAMLSFPVKFTLGMGQINFFILLFTCLSFYWYRNKQQFLSGSALAIAVSLKLSPILLLLFFIRKRQWYVVISCLAGIILLNGLGALLLGTSVSSYYWQQIFPAIPTVGNAIYYNQALTGWLARAEIDGQLARVINYLVLGSMLIVNWQYSKATKQTTVIELGELGLLVISVLVGTGLAWQHHFVSVVIPLVALLAINSVGKRIQVIPLTFVGLAYVLIAGNLKNPSLVEGFWKYLLLSHVLIGALLLYGLLLWTLASRSREKAEK